MKKTVISLLTALALSSSAIAALAADKTNSEPDVFVDGSMIMFDDQNAKIINDVTLVPARGVFECMGHSVDWDDATRTVTVKSSTGVRTVTIKIDSDIMEIATFKTIFEQEKTEYKLEVPAQIINDRTMIPLRAVSEAFDCDVEWDQENYRIDITTGDDILLEGANPTPKPSENEMLTMSLSTDTTTIKAGDEITVYLDAKNMPSDMYLSGISAVFKYDKSKFEFVSGTMLSDSGEPLEATVYAENPDYAAGAKIIYVIITGENARTTDGHFYKATFKSLTGESGTIELSNNFEPIRGFESYLMLSKVDNDENSTYKGKNIIVDKTPIKIGE